MAEEGRQLDVLKLRDYGQWRQAAATAKDAWKKSWNTDQDPEALATSSTQSSDGGLGKFTGLWSKFSIDTGTIDLQVKTCFVWTSSTKPKGVDLLQAAGVSGRVIDGWAQTGKPLLVAGA